MTALPTRDEIMGMALARLMQARNALSEARDWLNSDWQPIGSPLTDDQADARATTRRVITTCKDEIDTAAEALRRALDGAR